MKTTANPAAPCPTAATASPEIAIATAEPVESAIDSTEELKPSFLCVE